MSSLFDLTGRSALITGASRGLGRQLATTLAMAGANVALTARDSAALERVASEIAAETGRSALTFVADLQARVDQDRLIAEVSDRFGSPDILINNAGQYGVQTIENIEDIAWDGLVEVNMTSCMRLIRGFAPGMVARNWGRIINVSSILWQGSRVGAGCYSASKAALVGMTRAFALELGPAGVTVNCIAPGAFNVIEPCASPNERQRANFARSTALGRWGKPAELAGPVLMLASDAGSYITGAVIVVDGGALCHTLY